MVLNTFYESLFADDLNFLETLINKKILSNQVKYIIVLNGINLSEVSLTTQAEALLDQLRAADIF